MKVNEKLKACSKCERELPLTNEYFLRRSSNSDGIEGVGLHPIRVNC